MAAKSMSDARLTPIVGAFPKMLLPFIVILPGIAAVALAKMDLGSALPMKGAVPNYDLALTTLMAKSCPSVLLGVGLTGLMASFMSGMAGNVTAFNTVWTYDVYQGYIRKKAPDSHYLTVARISTVVGVLLSIGAAYLATLYNNIMDLLQLVFGFVNAPLLPTFLLGMFWKRSTGNGAFCGLVAGTAAATLTHGLTMAEGKGAWIANVQEFPSTMAQNLGIALIAFTATSPVTRDGPCCPSQGSRPSAPEAPRRPAKGFVATILLSVMTKSKAAGDLKGLVHGLTEMPSREGVKWHKRPGVIAVAASVACLLLNFLFW
jgi:solute:Na+ symporter, SSS family